MYPFIDFPVFGPVPPTGCDSLNAILTYIKPGFGAWIYRLGDRVVGRDQGGTRIPTHSFIGNQLVREQINPAAVLVRLCKYVLGSFVNHRRKG